MTQKPLFVLAALVTKYEGNQSITSLTSGYHYANNREEAIGSFFLSTLKAKKGFEVSEILCQLVEEAENGDKVIPPLNGGTHYAKDKTGQWYYINHANTWQTCPPPFPLDPTPKPEREEMPAPAQTHDIMTALAVGWGISRNEAKRRMHSYMYSVPERKISE